MRFLFSFSSNFQSEIILARLQNLASRNRSKFNVRDEMRLFVLLGHYIFLL